MSSLGITREVAERAILTITQNVSIRAEELTPKMFESLYKAIKG